MKTPIKKIEIEDGMLYLHFETHELANKFWCELNADFGIVNDLHVFTKYKESCLIFKLDRPLKLEEVYS